MKNLSKTLIAIALALAVQQAGAATAAETPANVFSAEDATLAFGDAGQAVEVAALSADEMAQTQGAYLIKTFYRSPAQSTYLSYSKMPRSSVGASKVGMSLINTSFSNNSAYKPWNASLSKLAFSKVGGYSRPF